MANFYRLIILPSGCVLTSWISLYIQYFCLFIKITNPPYRKLKGNTLEYDAYVSYCYSAYDWVKNHLCEFLEKRHKYRLFLYNRDGFAGLEKNPAFKESISKCKKIIYVISKDFINDIDSNQEFTIGQQHFLGLQTRIIAINFEGIRHTEQTCVLKQTYWTKITLSG
ncbi:SIGIRR [Mytilus coruscus]|uniref:SIGIRR n=1 Tax=Mytilus coruscus TaxID=42192 RepID=A0A6J8A4G6_MYTCO|nr:SIGIRR [Mytilus coruscus]